MAEFSSPPPEEILAFSEKYSRRLGGGNNHRWRGSDREDFAQELAIRLLRATERFHGKIPWSAYANILARGALLDWYRKLDNHEILSKNTSDASFDESFGDSRWESLFVTEDFIDLTPAEIVEWSKQFDKTKQKVIICLALSYSRAEIGRLLNLSPKVLEKHIAAIQASILSQYAN